jgi:DNA replication protein DnaC
MAPLPDVLKLLGLHHTAEHLDDLVALATKRRWSPTQLLEHLADVEQQERARRSLERRLLRSRLGRIAPMEAFDWAWPTRIDRAAVEAALRLDFLAAGRHGVLVAAQGLGKTMIAQNIAHQAVLAGHHVLFTTAAQLLLDLGSQESDRGLARRLNAYGQRGLLVLDELGYLSYDTRAADLLFQVVSRRYERKSLVLTTNLAFSDWPTIFPNPAAPSPSSTGSSITPTSSPSKATAIAGGPPKSPARPPVRSQRRDPPRHPSKFPLFSESSNISEVPARSTVAR